AIFGLHVGRVAILPAPNRTIEEVRLTLEYRFDDSFAVDRIGHRLAQLHIVPGRRVDVHRQEHALGRRHAHRLEALRAFDAWNEMGRDRHRDLHLAIEERGDAGFFLADAPKDDAVR